MQKLELASQEKMRKLELEYMQEIEEKRRELEKNETSTTEQCVRKQQNATRERLFI